MTTWTRAEVLTLCGGCPRQIARGEPLHVREIAGIRRVFLRCQACAGSAPPDLPLLVESKRTKRMEPVRTVAARAVRDFRQAQAGEREPGIEG